MVCGKINGIMTAKTTHQPTVYREPTYELTLSSLGAPQSSHFQSVAQKNTPYKSLDHLVDEVMRERYGEKLSSFSKEKVAKLRLQAAHSLTNRPDQKSSLKIRLPLAQAQGLVKTAADRLNKVPNIPEDTDLTPLAEFIFSDCKEEDFGFILNCKLNMLFSKNPELHQALFKEICQIRDELKLLTDSTMKLYRPSQGANGKSYIDHTGKTVTLSQTIPSSFDRDTLDVQNGRYNLDSNGHVIYSTGRIETERKARQVLSQLIHQTFTSGQLSTDDLILQSDGSYLYPVVIENLISATPLIENERKFLLQEDEVLKKLSGSNITVGNITVKLKLLHFSTQTNYNAFFGQTHGWVCTGADIAEKMANEGTKGLQDYYNLKKASLKETTRQSIEYCLPLLENCSDLRNRLMYRSFICELLNIPYHVHCKSSKDRTAAIAAIKKALHQWIRLQAWQGNNLSDPTKLFDTPIFQEYSEAAFFENLPFTDQGVGFSGVLDGMLYTPNRGFSFQKSAFEHPIPVDVLTDRYVYEAPMIERILYATVALAASALLATFYIPCMPFVVLALYFSGREECLSSALYIFLTILVLPVQSGFRKQWLKRDSETLTERQFFLQKKKPTLAPALQQICDEVDKSNSQLYTNLLRIVQNGLSGNTQPSKDETKLLKLIAENWDALQKADGLSSRVRTLVFAGQNSPTQLFKMLNTYNPTFILGALGQLPSQWPGDHYVDALVRNPPNEKGLRQQFLLDIPRTEYKVYTQDQAHDFPTTEDRERTTQFINTIRQLSALKEEPHIPYAVQECLSQQMDLSYILLGAHLIQPMSMSDKTVVIEERDSSSFGITIHQKGRARNTNNSQKNLLILNFNYRFVISKNANNEWSTQLVSLSPFTAQLDDDLTPLLQNIGSHDAFAHISETACGYFKNAIESDFEAIKLWNDQSVVSFEQLEGQLNKHIEIMEKYFPEQWKKCAKEYYGKCSKLQPNAQSEQGKKLLQELAVTKI